MLGRSQFESIRQRHGGYASWAVWAPPSEGPKSNIGDLSILDPDANASLFETLKGGSPPLPRDIPGQARGGSRKRRKVLIVTHCSSSIGKRVASLLGEMSWLPLTLDQSSWPGEKSPTSCRIHLRRLHFVPKNLPRSQAADHTFSPAIS